MTQPTMVPYFTYENGDAAVAFLKAAFGFEVVQRADDESGTLLHCEMRYGDGVIMMGSGMATKGSPGVYVVVADVSEHHARAKAAGAKIVYPPEKTEWGTERYRCTDLEGHEWSFGSYAPSTEPPEWA